tara:strand:- start:277 stop:474 length:198 start_codon:yes stop_codon:yes gene_type:complete
MTLIFWLTNMIFISIITTLFYFIGWWAVPLMMMFSSTIAALVIHFVISTPTTSQKDLGHQRSTFA